ncbi:MerR family transcriptional regulator [Actinoplanes sp. TFC3]|uniref:MerR family transcriptional regulator n=1 Tax=Actinoplanes sp. TFC3 TaxID=1710355 RepID=UPI00082B38BB|nr:MerR family transcriptional regulator [Actinoplanes sp. TFC3]
MADEALTAGAVARRLGVAVTTLRTWHQRYGLGPSHHVPGQHRRYTAEDLDRLQVMRRLTAQGVPPSEAASWARRLSSASTLEPLEPPPAPKPARDGGGNTIPTGRAGPVARGVARAAMRLDAPALREILASTVLERGVVAAWKEVMMPVLIGIGERYEATKRFIEVEHVISRAITEVLSSVPRPPSSEIPHVLLAAADEELHTLPLEALAAALAEAGVPTRLLGARMPPQALVDAVTRTGPDVVVLWSQLSSTAHVAQWEKLLTGGHRPPLAAAAGPGWPAEGLPDGVVRLGSLDEGVRMIAALFESGARHTAAS